MENFVPETIWFQGFKYKTVQSPTTGRVWLDRNLGVNDTNIHGDYFKFGKVLYPEGFEVPSAEDWNNELLKSENIDLTWLNIPLGGYQSTHGTIHNFGNMAHLWSSSRIHSTPISYRRSVYSEGQSVFPYMFDNKEFGFNIRLIKQ